MPTQRLLGLGAAWLGAAIGVALDWVSAAQWLWIGVALGAMAAIDALLTTASIRPTARRQHGGIFAAGRWHDVRLTLSNDSRRPIFARVHDGYPSHFEARNLPAEALLPARGWAQITYAARSVRRGQFQFAPVDLRLRSPLGLFEHQVRAGGSETVRVYPDFGALVGYALLATDHRLSQFGVLQRRRRGEGMDFHQLREYRVGDSLRRIDWKATSRMHRLISREYQDERDQAIMILLDCGRRMTARDGELSHFDAALNAALLLAHVGLHHGDAVGAMTMGGEERFIAPRKSRATITLLLQNFYDLEPSTRPSDYHTAALELMRRVRKRALVIVLSNLRDEDDETLTPALSLLRRRHLVLFASLRERILTQSLASPITDFDSALTHAAAAEYLRDRAASFRLLERAGGHVLDVEPQDLALALVNRYLDIKRGGML